MLLNSIRNSNIGPPKRHWRNPMDYLKLFYGVLGAKYPLASLIAVSSLGALIFGAMWWAIGKEYQKTLGTPAEKITYTEQRIASPRSQLPNGLSVTLQTNIQISPTHLRIEFSAPIGEAHVRFAGPVSVMMGMIEKVEGNTFDFFIQSPPFAPQNPLEVELFSATPISVLKVIHVY